MRPETLSIPRTVEPTLFPAQRKRIAIQILAPYFKVNYPNLFYGNKNKRMRSTCYLHVCISPFKQLNQMTDISKPNMKIIPLGETPRS